MPSKATLGKGFLVAKFHTFDLLRKVAEKAGMAREDLASFRDSTATQLFNMMVDDVYLTLLDSSRISQELRLQVATALIFSWEHRSDLIANETALALEEVWRARTQIVPVFGTMGCRTEFVEFAQTMDAAWVRFVRSRLDDQYPEQNDVELSVEEFLFGVSYEQIQALRSTLEQKRLKSITRQDAYARLGETVNPNDDLNDFYMGYTIRRDNAAVRRRLNLPGPHHTLEYHYMTWMLGQIMEQHKLDLTKYDEYFLRQFGKPPES
jgi:hypothetical protein